MYHTFDVWKKDRLDLTSKPAGSFDYRWQANRCAAELTRQGTPAGVTKTPHKGKRPTASKIWYDDTDDEVFDQYY